jgi:tricorn protease
MILLVSLLVCPPFAIPSAEAADEDLTRLLRFADIHEDKIVFVYAGDIWIVGSEGGQARRLTSHDGLELFPKFSPDGEWIAFSAEYSGNRQVFVMSTAGGTPRQLTYHNDVGPMPPRGGFDNQVLDWSPDGKLVLFRANRLPWGVRMGRPYVVPFEGGMERPLEVPESGGGMYSPDGTKLVYTPISREFRTWKRYRGGRAQDVWIYDLEAHSAEPVTDHDATDNQPVWVGDTIYFTSDREAGRLNLYAYDTSTRQIDPVTSHEDFDVLWPSAGPRQVVYECGGYLYRFDPSTGDSHRVPIKVTGDFLGRMARFEKVSEQISSGAISPTGKRVVFEARGDLFTVPAEEGPVRNLTRTPGIRELDPIWSPDGRWIAYLSDRSGEYELYVMAQDGSGEERRITTDGDTWRFAPVWSPDSSKIAYGDTKLRLRYVDVDSGRTVDVDTGTYAPIRRYRWSPDSKWLVYDKVGPSRFSSIFVYSLDARQVQRLTDDFTNDYDPDFDPQGRYLYFFSDRDYNLTFSGYEFNYFYTRPARVYAATLRADGPALLVPKSDEESPASEDADAKDEAEGGAKEGGKKDENGAAPVRIDFDGFAERVVALPGSSDDYDSLAAADKGVIFVQGRGPDAAVKMFLVEGEKTETLLPGIRAYDASSDGKKLLYRMNDTYGIVDLKPGQKPGDGKLKLDDMVMKVEPEAEWRQIFVDGWRITRDWFYDAGMHGVDWGAVRRLYEPLVDSVAHRADLDYIFGEMGGELNAGHYYVNWGDMPRPERIDGGLLGAEIEADASGYFRVAKIFPGENWHDEFRSPLTVAGVDVSEGDLILAVDGRSTRDVKNFYELLENTVGQQVTLLVNHEPDVEGAREEVVRPVARETNLRYLDWVQSRRQRVDELSGGRIGYIHLPNTAAAGNRELRKYFYPQSDKDALIIDVRYNGGGFIPDRMIELVSRKPLSYWARRGVEPTRTPGYAHDGPKACLINAYSASGGDAFPYYFRMAGLGPLIGMRTWGGLIGLSGNPGFMDGGSVSVPTFRFYDVDGEWAVENVGVEPDIEVLDRPDLVAKGEDPTLEEAVKVLMEDLRKNPPSAPVEPAPPRTPR